MVGLHAIITKETLLVTYTCTMHALDAECQGEKKKVPIMYVEQIGWEGKVNLINKALSEKILRKSQSTLEGIS